MKIFIDTANLDEIRRAAEMGVLDGVTTNPSLVAKEKCNFKERVIEICNIVDGPVSAEVVATDTAGILSEGREIAGWHKNIVVKVPLIDDGIKAIVQFSKEGIRTNCTLCFSAVQAYIAAKAGATYISPFAGRLDDIGHDGLEIIGQIRQIYDNYGYETEILAASLRHPKHVLEALMIGADVATIPGSIISMLTRHPLTDKGLASFLADWEKVKDLV
ncbi:MAG: fructose-6-phosphate aldolase [Planctomycetales bacterium]|nr:fructose-6-phosphate aldolase [bacterium]UNM08468.1 MAG: fructose-6-phosphate aldolase [Planctomycetales bacterium]